MPFEHPVSHSSSSLLKKGKEWVEKNKEEKVVQEMIRRLRVGEGHSAIWGVPEHILEAAKGREDVLEAAQRCIILLLENATTYSVYGVSDIEKILEFSPERSQYCARVALLHGLLYGNSHTVNSALAFAKLPEDVLRSRQILASAKQGMIKWLGDGRLQYVISLKRTLGIAPEFFHDPDFTEALIIGIKTEAKEHIRAVQDFASELGLTETFFLHPELQAFGKQLVLNYLTVDKKKYSYLGYAHTVESIFHLPEAIYEDEAIKSAAEKILVEILGKGRPKDAESFEKELHLKEVNDIPGATSAAKKALSFCNDINDVFYLVGRYHFSPQVLRYSGAAAIGMRVLEKLLQGSGRLEIERAGEIQQMFQFSSRFLEDLAVECVKKRGSSSLSFLQMLGEYLKLPETFYRRPEINSLIKKETSSLLGRAVSPKGGIDALRPIRELYPFGDEVTEDEEVKKSVHQVIYSWCEDRPDLDTENIVKFAQIFKIDIFSDTVLRRVIAKKCHVIDSRTHNDKISKIQDFFQLTQEEMKEGEMLYELDGDPQYFFQVKRKKNFPDSLLKENPFVSHFYSSLMQNLAKGQFDFFRRENFETEEGWGWFLSLCRDPEIEKAIINALKKELTQARTVEILKLELQSEEMKWFVLLLLKAGEEAALTLLREGRMSSALQAAKAAGVPESFFHTEESRSAALDGIQRQVAAGDVQAAVHIQKDLHLQLEEETKKKVKDSFLKYFFNARGGLETHRGRFEDLQKMGASIDLTPSSPDKEIFMAAHLFLGKDMGVFNVSPQLLSEEEFQTLFTVARGRFRGWSENGLANAFEQGVSIFGHVRMLEFIQRENLTLHDALHAFHHILSLYKASGLSPDAFYGNILYQVLRDNQTYEAGTAHHQLNSIASSLQGKDLALVLSQAKEFSGIEGVERLASTFSSLEDIFASWSSLKKFSSLVQLLGQNEILKELKELKEQKKDKLYHYIETLAFHPDSKVNTQKVLEFWRKTKDFLSANATYTPQAVHDRKKPSNYVEIPNLDLTAEELRDALVEGDMDALSVFTPMEARYQVSMEDRPLGELFKEALGSQKDKVKGKARDSKKLFSEVNKILKPLQISVKEYLDGKELPSEAISSLRTLLYHPDFGMPLSRVTTREFIVAIAQKSDPEAVLAGDDTACCMPFGDGKNTVYMFNPNTAHLIVRMSKGDGKYRTIAQSVLTKDMDIKRPIPEVITLLQQEGRHMEETLPQDILDDAPLYLACDNVEIARNYTTDQYKEILEELYRDFFQEYMQRYGREGNLVNEQIIIGKPGYGSQGDLKQLDTIPNTFAPQAPVSYSDKTGERVYVLDLRKASDPTLLLHKTVKEQSDEKKKDAPVPFPGVGYLTFEDALKVGYLEGKAYKDNPTLMQFLFDMENGLIAKDINNAAKNRPNMSLKYTDEQGKMRGYLLAWEGRLEKTPYKGERCIYISDLASDRESKLAGGRLIQAFMTLYQQNYLAKKNPLPIYMQTREKTSYRIVKNQLKRIGRELGKEFILEELPSYEQGEDVMHPLLVRMKEE